MESASDMGETHKGIAMVELGLVLSGVLGLLFFCAVLVRWNELMLRGKALPGGTMGWPLLGETIGFLTDLRNFLKNRKLLYGNLFKSHLFGFPTVVSMDQDVNRFVFLNEGKGLAPAYPKAMLDVVGNWHVTAVHGALHKSIRGAMLSLIGPTALREQHLPKLDSFMQSYLDGLGGQIVDIQEKTRKMATLVPVKVIAGIKTGQVAEVLVEELTKIFHGTFVLPLNLPGTKYRSALKARKKVVSILGDVLRERRRATSSEGTDVLSSLLLEDQEDRRLTDKQIIDVLIGLAFGGFETVSAASMMALKFLLDHPRALQEAREEHLEIRKRKSTGEAIHWQDYKSMTFTRAVILETLRLATIVTGVPRKTTGDLEINGFTIPRGWKIFLYIRDNNFDPFQYPEPLQFNPWRWQDKSLESNQYFTVFGGGIRLCPGKELGILEVSMFLHYFLTRYRWEEIGRQKIVQFPRVEAPKGYHCRVWNI